MIKAMGYLGFGLGWLLINTEAIERVAERQHASDVLIASVKTLCVLLWPLFFVSFMVAFVFNTIFRKGDKNE